MNITLWVIVGSLLALIGYDIYAVIRFGVQGTISAFISENAKKYPLIPFALGLLIGHWIWS